MKDQPRRQDAKHSDKPLFTVILEYSGTTSASQVRASDPAETLQVWLGVLEDGERYGLTTDQASKLRSASDFQEKLVAVQGLENVSCKMALEGKELAVLHVIKTSRAQE